MYAPLEYEPAAFHRYIYVFVCTVIACNQKKLKTCTNKSSGIYVYRSQLPEKNAIIDFDIDSGLATLTQEIKPDLPALSIIASVSEIATKLMSPARQQEIIDDEVADDEISEEDEEAELRDESFRIYKRFDKATPSHIIRYSFDEHSKPLFYSDYDQFDVKTKKACEHCGAPRYFEFQINTQLLSLVKPLVEADWGIVAIYSCSKTCSVKDKLYVRERAEVQIAPEEMDKHNMRRVHERRVKEFEKDLHDNGDDIPMEDEIAIIQEQIKLEEEMDAEVKREMKLKSKKGGLQVIEEKKGKLFDEEEGSDDDWA